MKIVKVGSTKITGTPVKPKLTKAQKQTKRSTARKIATRSSFEPVKQQKPTNALLKRRAKEMRRKPTYAERRMGERLIECGVKHRTQVVIGWYIADILIENKRLIIEMDGQHHYTDEGSLSDFRRTKWLEQFGFTVLRCANGDVEQFDLQQLDNYEATVKANRNLGVGAANKERNRALYHAPVQQERYKAKRKQKKTLEAWERVPKIDKRGRIIK
jgi:very-short-patch-repair endonuclease